MPIAAHPISQRSGITIIEVLTAMVVAMIGVFGVMILIPFAVKQAEVGLDLDDAYRQAQNGIDQLQIDGHFRLASNGLPTLFAKDSMGNITQVNRTDPRIDTYVIDPLSIFANGEVYDQFPPSYSITESGFAVNDIPFIGEANLSTFTGMTTGPEIARWGTNNDGTPNFVRGQALARRMFQSFDDLQFGDAATDLDPPQQIYDVDVTNTAVGRQARGEMSWMAMMVPSYDAGSQSGTEWKFRLYAMVFENRLLLSDGSLGSTRFPIARVDRSGFVDATIKDVGYGGGNIDLVDANDLPIVISNVRKDDWIMLVNENPEIEMTNPGYGKQIGFYRVLSTFNNDFDGDGVVDKATITLDGPDFVFDYLDSSGQWQQMDTYAVHLVNFDGSVRQGHVVSVYERTFAWEQDSAWNQ